MNNQPNQPTPEEQAAFAAEMNREHTLTFTKGELTAIFNILTSVQVKYGDFVVIDPIVKKIHPIVAVASNIDSNHKSDKELIGVKKGSN